MKWNMRLFAAASLLTLGACGIYQDYPNDSGAANLDMADKSYQGQSNYSGNHPYAVDNSQGDVVIGQDKESYMRQNDDKWMYNSCPPGAAKRGDC